MTGMKSLSRAESAYDARNDPVGRNAFFMPDRNLTTDRAQTCARQCLVRTTYSLKLATSELNEVASRDSS